jgi:hypothetical protein
MGIKTEGHLHDGGINLIVRLNGKLVCDSEAMYTGGNSTADSGQPKWETISEMTKCREPVQVKKGDNFTLEAKYDFIKRPA